MLPSIAMIQLIGPGGAGKSTVGVALATRLGCPFRDLDREFKRRRTDITTFMGVHGYDAYARENVAVPRVRSLPPARRTGPLLRLHGLPTGCAELPAVKVETMRPPHEVAAAIHARLAAEAPEALPAALRTPGADHRRHLLGMQPSRTQN